MLKAIAMTEKMMISSVMVNNLRYSWLKGFDAREIQRLVQTLQEMVEWFTCNRPTIENAENFPRAIRLFLHLKSHFLHVFEHLGNVLFKCNSFPYNETVTNEWFTLPDDKKDRKQPVMVMNVNEEGKESECYLSQNGVDDFMNSLIDDGDHEVFFHGTEHDSAEDIIEGGIDLKRGERCQDFSNGDGFYLGDDFKEARRWPASRGNPDVAVLVFCVEKTELRGPYNGLDLRKNKKRWSELIKQFRKGRPANKFLNTLEKFDFIEGPMADWSSSDRKSRHGTYQLCVKDGRCVEIFDRSLHSVIFFEP